MPDPAARTADQAPERAGLWPHLRAVLITFHLVAIVLVALPAPVGGMHRSAWRELTVQAEFQSWSGILGVEQDTLEEAAWKVASDWMRIRKSLLAPVRRYIAATGADQPWRMFVAPHRHPARFQVQVREEAERDAWLTLFEERSPEHRWREPLFRQERMRSIIFRHSWPSYAYDAKRACNWIGQQVFEERPEAKEVRCRYWKAPSPSPAEVRAGTAPDGRWVQSRIIRRPKPMNKTTPAVARPPGEVPGPDR